jgi:hypothetical protein
MHITIMKNNPAIRCPVCQAAMVPIQLHCSGCEISVSGRFPSNEFAALAEDDLHFLRIFVLCEGRIREMESALGVSYPTIKTRLAQLKETLAAKTPTETPAEPKPLTPSESILHDLETGRLTFDQAMQKLKLAREKKP